MIITGQFNDSLPPIMDGVAVAAYNYAYWLNKKHGPSFAVGPLVPQRGETAGAQPKDSGFSSEQANVLRYRSLRTVIADPYRLGVPRVDRSFNKTIELIPFDLIHAHCPFISGNYAYTLAKKRNIPLVATFHSKYRDDFASWMRLDLFIDQAISLIVRFYEQADSVWVPNEAIIETLRSYGYKGPVEYVPNGSDISLESSENAEKVAAQGREILQADTESPVLLYVGQHRWIKNLRMLIDSLKILRNSGTAFQMRFVGTGEDAEEMQQYVLKNGLSEYIRFIGPVYERAQLKTAYAAAALFLFPSLYDNASLATREAAGLSVPTLFVRGATTANGIEDGHNGFLADNDAASYATKIKSVLENTELRKHTGEEARHSLYLSWEKISSIVYEKYSEILDEYKYRQIRNITGTQRTRPGKKPRTAINNN